MAHTTGIVCDGLVINKILIKSNNSKENVNKDTIYTAKDTDKDCKDLHF